MVKIEIDGQTLEAEQGAMIIEVADDAGIRIPRFCYHKKLSVAANCRMCLVEVEGGRKPMPACATPVSDGMKVKTQSELARDGQQSVMEFLLINHPLDCPICDQGGECELQDVAMGYGSDVSQYTEGKRVIADKNIGPLIQTDMTRCIHCTRCVRFGREVAGIREMGATGRGEHMEIGTFIEKSVDSEVSGNIIDLCPVGALVAKPSRFQARAWEMKQSPSIAPHDCIGSNINIHTRRGQLIRVVPDENEACNETWLSDRDRFSYEALKSGERLLEPQIKVDGQWQATDWHTALEMAAGGLRKATEQYGGVEIGALASPSSTTEEFYLLQKLMAGMGTNNVDHRMRISDFTLQNHEPLIPELGVELAELEERDVTFLIGANLRKQQPLAALRLRKSTLMGKVISLHFRECFNNFRVAHDMLVDEGKLTKYLAAILLALNEQNQDKSIPEDLVEVLSHVKIGDDAKQTAQMLLAGEKTSVVVGLDAVEHQHGSQILLLANWIAKLSDSTYGRMSHGGNSAGAYAAGAIPHRGTAGGERNSQGLDARTMLTQKQKAYLLLGTEPILDSSCPEQAKESLHAAEFVVALTAFADDQAREYADVLLPIAGFAETSGSYININGRWQSFSAALKAPGEARPAWKVLRVLGNLLNLKGFDYVSSKQVSKEVKNRMDAMGELTPNKPPIPEQLLEGGKAADEVNIYKIDPVVRRAPALQKTSDGLNKGVVKRPELSPIHVVQVG